MGGMFSSLAPRAAAKRALAWWEGKCNVEFALALVGLLFKEGNADVDEDVESLLPFLALKINVDSRLCMARAVRDAETATGIHTMGRCRRGRGWRACVWV